VIEDDGLVKELDLAFDEDFWFDFLPTFCLDVERAAAPG
jgi:hypothetical protein